MDQSIHDRDIFELYDEADEKMLKVNSLISRQSGMSPFIIIYFPRPGVMTQLVNVSVHKQDGGSHTDVRGR